MSKRTYVVGVGMTKFEKPGRREWDYPDMAREAGTKALEDAGIPVLEIHASNADPRTGGPDRIDRAVSGFIEERLLSREGRGPLRAAVRSR